MSKLKVERYDNLFATFEVCSDKSITVRAILFGAFAKGVTIISHPLICEDSETAVSCARTLGADVRCSYDEIKIIGADTISDGKAFDCRRSGTVLRLLCGLLAGAGVNAVLRCDEQLKRRPISRLTDILNERGANISLINGSVIIRPSVIHDFEYTMTTDSAQIKSAVILSGVTAGVKTVVIEKNFTRSHTENMLPLFGVDTHINGKNITVYPGKLVGAEINVPKDPSAAAYYLSLGIMLGCVRVNGLNVSEKRAGYLYKLLEAGADLSFINERIECGEKCADVIAVKSKLNHISVRCEEIATLIDELPIIGVIGSYFSGAEIDDATELRYKESDRFSETIKLVNAFGGRAYGAGEDMLIENGVKAKTFSYRSDDHRMTMAAFTAMLSGKGGVIENVESVRKSFPDFFNTFYSFNACLIGGDVGRSLSGNSHNFIIGKLGKLFNYTYQHKSVEQKEAVEILKKSSYRSINVTIPYKETAFEHAERLSAEAKLSRSVNFIYKGMGYSFDGEGFVMSLVKHGVYPAGKKFLVCGVGGAGRSIIAALYKSGAKISVFNRTIEKAVAFIKYFDKTSKESVTEEKDSSFCPSLYRPDESGNIVFDVVINATALKSDVPVTEKAFEGCRFMADVNYGNETAFIAYAKAKNIPFTDGEEMLFAQSYLADALVSGVEPCQSQFERLYDEWKSSREL